MTLERRREGSILLLGLAQPPVNALGHGLRLALTDALTQAKSDASASAVILYGTGKGFCAGGDRLEFGTPAAMARPTLSRDVLSAIEACGKPVVAAMHGFAVGGGLELALACDSRVAVADTQVGLPEVTIGRFALSGSQRLPRLLGIERAAAWMLRGNLLPAHAPELAPLFDQTVETLQELLPAATSLARAAVLSPPVPVRRREFPDRDPRESLRKVLDQRPPENRPPAEAALLDALRAAVEAQDFQAGLDHAQELFDRLVGAVPTE